MITTIQISYYCIKNLSDRKKIVSLYILNLEFFLNNIFALIKCTSLLYRNLEGVLCLGLLKFVFNKKDMSKLYLLMQKFINLFKTLSGLNKNEDYI